MRKDSPLSSLELNDKLLLSYENIIYLLGQHLPNKEKYSGLYDRLESTCSGLYISPSGIPSYNNDKIIDLLKFDYFYRKHFNQINRS